MIRVVLPHHLRTLARVGDEVEIDVNGGATLRSVLDTLEAKYPCCSRTIVITIRDNADRYCGSSRVEKIYPTNRPTRRCPTQRRSGTVLYYGRDCE